MVWRQLSSDTKLLLRPSRRGFSVLVTGVQPAYGVESPTVGAVGVDTFGVGVGDAHVIMCRYCRSGDISYS